MLRKAKLLNSIRCLAAKKIHVSFDASANVDRRRRKKNRGEQSEWDDSLPPTVEPRELIAQTIFLVALIFLGTIFERFDGKGSDDER